MDRKVFTDDDFGLLHKANVPVPEGWMELDQLLAESEKDPRELPLNEAFKEIRKRVSAQIKKANRRG